MSASGQDGMPSVQIAGLESEDWPQAQAVLTVLDETGRPVAALTDSNFSVFLDDASAPISGVERAVDSSLPIAVVLALDVSGSMSAEESGGLAQAKAASHRFLDALAADDTVAIVTFGTTVEIVLPFTTDRAAAEAAIDGLAAGGTTALYDATSESMELAGSVEGGRRAVVLLSDGIDNGSAIARDEAIAAADTLGAPLFAIGLGEEIDREYLQALADATGGRFAETPTPEGLAQLYAEAGELLRGQYIVTFDAAELGLAGSDATTLRVETTVGELAVFAERVVCPQQLCVALTSIVAGERLEEARTIVADIVASEPVEGVTFLVDGVVALELTEAPYEFTLAPASLGDGEHTITVEAITASTSVRAQDVTISVGAAGGSSMPVDPTMVGVLAGVIVAVLAIVYILLRRRGHSGEEESVERLRPQRPDGDGGVVARVKQPLWEEQEPLPLPTIGNVLGELRATSGPLAGQVFEVSGSPSSIGCGDGCLIRLPDDSAPDDQLVSEHARVWVRDGQLMVHEVKRLTERGAIGGAWQILAPGDDFTVWSHTFQFVPLGDEFDALRRPPVGNAPSAPLSNGEGASKASNGAEKDAGSPAPSNGAESAEGATSLSNGAETHEETPNILRDKPAVSAEANNAEPADVLRDKPVTDGEGSKPEADPPPTASS